MSINLGRQKGVMIIISSPSGAGKTTLTRKLVSDLKNAVLSISVTTRKKRDNEEEGLHYYFVDDDVFTQMVDEGNLLEHANVFGFNYGTPKDRVIENIQIGNDVIFDIDWQGAAQLKNNYEDNIISVFILPPTATELMGRLIKRDQDSIDTIKNRLNAAYDEIKHWNEYDYVIINDDLDVAYSELKSIVTSEKMKITKANTTHISKHVDQLLEELSDRLND
ncbi:MAG: guanylate kinase [Rhodobiaceae bacterium]|nr:guanylate kinase [Rhodobiaceae bacterium]|tara:strand:+ start:11071 stop:11733 length:663 start_codon:yes stop_codon:yes gene_type:complete